MAALEGDDIDRATLLSAAVPLMHADDPTVRSFAQTAGVYFYGQDHPVFANPGDHLKLIKVMTCLLRAINSPT